MKQTEIMNAAQLVLHHAHVGNMSDRCTAEAMLSTVWDNLSWQEH